MCGMPSETFGIWSWYGCGLWTICYPYGVGQDQGYATRLVGGGGGRRGDGGKKKKTKEEGGKGSLCS